MILNVFLQEKPCLSWVRRFVLVLSSVLCTLSHLTWKCLEVAVISRHINSGTKVHCSPTKSPGCILFCKLAVVTVTQEGLEASFLASAERGQRGHLRWRKVPRGPPGVLGRASGVLSPTFSLLGVCHE